LHFPLDLLDLQLNPKQFLLHLLLELLPPLEPKQLLMHLMPLLPTLDLLQDPLLSLKLDFARGGAADGIQRVRQRRGSGLGLLQYLS